MTLIEEQEQKLKKSLFDVLEDSTEENKQNYLQQSVEINEKDVSTN